MLSRLAVGSPPECCLSQIGSLEGMTETESGMWKVSGSTLEKCACVEVRQDWAEGKDKTQYFITESQFVLGDLRNCNGPSVLSQIET